MKANMGKVDRSLRMVLGTVIIILGFYFKSWFGLIGIIPILTSFISWCPLYVPFKFSSISKQKNN